MKSKVIVSAFTISLDGFGAGPNQSLEAPLGLRGNELHAWMLPTVMFQRMLGNNGGTEGVDNDFAEQSMKDIGAWIMGRNMFGPKRGPWPEEEWNGWWGDNPPYHGPVFVLTHHARPTLEMEGGTVFHFETKGIEIALQKAREVANGKSIRILGGADTIRQYLQAGHIDEIHFVISPIFLGSGEPLFTGLDIPGLGFNEIKRIEGEKGTHIILGKSDP
ncbi:MAG: deaminase [Spirochaetaceae bacterium]|nr:deaminase [Spirochaetaceae bacterium]|tara:strand:- start:44685 stop:45338 length:654 start_codon:yes stop_codon:yes gene_type:complete